jgi:Flp pilus assembly pilin Flp
MLNRAKDEKLDGVFHELCIKIQSLPSNEKGQALVEYSLLLVITSVFSSVIAIFQDHSIIVITIMAFLLFFLFWKPKVTATVVFIMLLLYGLYRYVEFGHI